ncbi:hypothetical protein [Nocardioides alkalitolerans]|uniref:phage tail tube protein n=1 Tax=Nocardioides alkalitolerans TaxID=281714 RepID=UPI00040D4DAC|nr:hypothetical protein [Nocardioides alkalitolerans]
MALDSSKVRVAITGVVSVGDRTATPPTGTGSAITPAFKDVGWISDAGVTRTMPSQGEATRIPGWQNGATVRTIRSAPTENPTYKLVMLETKIEVVQFVLGVTVTSTATEGSYEIDTSKPRKHQRMVLDVIDEAELIRDFIPYGIATEIGDQVYANGAPIGWEVTVEGERDPVLGYNAKQWNTGLKTPA